MIVQALMTSGPVAVRVKNPVETVLGLLDDAHPARPATPGTGSTEPHRHHGSLEVAEP
jgi:hypothetical protein